jgi:SAM-dependent methyltransferase
MPELLQRVRKRFRLPAALFKRVHRGRPRFECPLCGYLGPFRDLDGFAGRRRHAECPGCGALERHRLQQVILLQVLNTRDVSQKKMLHFAPEPFFRGFFFTRFGGYETADLCMKGVDHLVDLQKLPFKDASFDFVFASNVLEHVPDDLLAIREIRRILKPDGLAVLPVPVVAEKTIEYPAANPHEAFHFRAPGFDYDQKFKAFFSRVACFTSESVPEKYQPFIYEDRSHWPTREMPLRPPMAGVRHLDVVPVCYV